MNSKLEFLIIVILCALISAGVVYVKHAYGINPNHIYLIMVGAVVVYLIKVFLSPTNYKKIVLSEEYIELVRKNGSSSFKCSWESIDKLWYFRGDDQNYRMDEEGIGIGTVQGRMYFLPLEFPDKRRVMNFVLSKFDEADFESIREFIKSKEHGSHIIWKNSA